MATRKNRTILLLLIVVVLVVIWVHRNYLPQIRAPQTSSPGCDGTLWQHVYHSNRLEVIDACKTVEGTISHIRKEPDGDLHIRLRVDDASLVNEKNLSAQHGDLVLELICMHPPTQQDAVAACEGFTQNLPVPAVGDRVRVTGAYVLDREHGWNEIHPITRLEILR